MPKLRIAELATKKNLTYKEIGERSGIGANMISYYVKEKVSPPIKNLEKIAEAIGCDFLELFEPTSEGAGHFYVNDKWQGVRN